MCSPPSKALTSQRRLDDSTPPKEILCAGPFPAYQRTLFLDEIRTGSVHRIRDIRESVGGKSCNAARMLRSLHAPCRVTGFLGGDTGRRAERMLRREGIRFRFADGIYPTRICHTLVSSTTDQTTELVEEGRIPPPRAWDEWFALVKKLLPRTGLLLLSGTLPPRAPVDTWAVLAQSARKRGIPVLLDSRGEPLRRAVAARPWLVKPNAEELADTASLRNTGESELWRGIERLQAWGAQAVLVTRGEKPALLAGKRGRWRLHPAHVTCRNPIGCGDILAAVLAEGYVRGRPLARAACRGMAAATARCLYPEHRAPSPAEIRPWEPKIRCEKLASY